MTDVRSYHEPVLVDEVLAFLDPKDDGLYLDGTVGGGGHALAILRTSPGCRLLALDRDPEALGEARQALQDERGRVRFIAGRFDEAASDIEVRDRGLDGALLDLGVSSHQLDDEARGFSFARGAELDMRMGRGREDLPTAAHLLNDLSEAELAAIFRDLAEEPRARRLAREVVKRRKTEPFRTSDQLVAALSVALGRAPSPRGKARVFQGLRMAVNDEVAALTEALPALRDVLVDGGVLVVIAYHSGEDRVVKHAFREWSRACVCPPSFPCAAAGAGRWGPR